MTERRLLNTSYSSQDNRDQDTNESDAPGETNIDTESSASRSISLSSLKEDLNDVAQDTKVLFEEHSQLLTIPFPTRELQKFNDQVDLSWAFVLIIQHFQDANHNRAKKQIKRALTLARKLEDKHIIARCFYWLGRVYFQKKEFHKANLYFNKARPNLDGRISSEGETIDFYLMLCTPGLSPQYKRSLLIEYNRCVTERYSRGDPQKLSRNPVHFPMQNPQKRKRDVDDIKVVLRSTEQYTTDNWGLKSSDRSKDRFISCPRRKVIWMKPYTDDIAPCKRPEVVKWTVEKPIASQLKRFPSFVGNRGKFTFRRHPIGLSGFRTRTRDIFSLQPGEATLSFEEGEKLEMAMRGEKITMKFLERERVFMAGRANMDIQVRSTETEPKGRDLVSCYPEGGPRSDLFVNRSSGVRLALLAAPVKPAI